MSSLGSLGGTHVQTETSTSQFKPVLPNNTSIRGSQTKSERFVDVQKEEQTNLPTKKDARSPVSSDGPNTACSFHSITAANTTEELQALEDAEVKRLCEAVSAKQSHHPPLRDLEMYGGLPSMSEFSKHYTRLIQLSIDRNNARTVPYRNSCRLVVDWLLGFMQDRRLPSYLQFEGVDDMTTVEILAQDVPASQYTTVHRMMYGTDSGF